MKQKIYAIPGTMCDERLWVKLASTESEKFDFIHTPIPNEGSIEAICSEIIDKLPADNIILLGFSFGGYIASCIASKIPDRIKHLFVISNSACSLNEHELSERKRNIELIKKYGYRGVSVKKASSMLDLDSLNDELVSTIIEMDSNMGADTLINQWVVGSDRPDLYAALTNANVNITFIFSEDDNLIDKEWVLKFTRNNKKSNVISIFGSGHMLPLEKPYEIVEIFKRQLDN